MVGAAIVAVVVAGREGAAKVLLEADVGFFREAGRVGIEGLEKIADFLLDPGLLVARQDDLTRLDAVVHFPLHPYSSPKEHRFSFQGGPYSDHCLNTRAMRKFRFSGGTSKYPELLVG